MTPAVVLLLANAPSSAPSTPAETSGGSEIAVVRASHPEIVVPAVHSLTLLTTMRATEAYLWPEPFARTQSFGEHYEEAVTKPPIFDPHKPFMRWDGDSLTINVVGHGLFGSELYLRARQCRFGWGGSFAFAAATSALWEYGFEGSGVRPSAQDLVYTPLMGLVLGEVRYQIHRAAGSLHEPAARSVVRALVDPFGELERGLGTDC